MQKTVTESVRFGGRAPPLAANEGGEAKTLKNSVLREEMHSFRVFIAY